jgi:riboflavin kinase/FMN adenylyltransferase
LHRQSANQASKSPARPFLVVRDASAAIAALQGGVVAIGNFDGVHRGHRTVIAAAARSARALGRPGVALTFDPHPRRFLRPQVPLFQLTDLTAKLRLLAASGLDGALVLTFDAALASLSAEDFIARILVGRLAVKGVAIGFDFHYGKDRRGSPAFLAAEGERLGFAVEILPPLEDEGRPVSSSSIRAALASGRVIEAAELIGHPWFVTGTVVPGDRRGRTLGYPTANLRLDPECGLKHGIYAVRARVGEEPRDGVASFGRRPTFGDGPPLLEVHLFDFGDELYGATIDVAFIGWIRAEAKFDSAEDLVRRMHEDSRRAHEALARTGAAFPPLGTFVEG